MTDEAQRLLQNCVAEGAPFMKLARFLIKKAMQSLLKSTLWNACKWFTLMNVHQLMDHVPELVNERVQSKEF